MRLTGGLIWLRDVRIVFFFLTCSALRQIFIRRLNPSHLETPDSRILLDFLAQISSSEIDHFCKSQPEILKFCRVLCKRQHDLSAEV